MRRTTLSATGTTVAAAAMVGLACLWPMSSGFAQTGAGDLGASGRDLSAHALSAHALSAHALSAHALSAHAQAAPKSKRAPVRIRVTPRCPYRTETLDHPPPYDCEFPGPGFVRQCSARLVQEYRPSGTVIVPRMQCWWERG